MKRTKIICTMGPNTDDEEMMRKLAKAGMDIARFNFSHGDHEEQKTRMDLLKKVRKELKLPIAILLDTKDRKSVPVSWRADRKYIWKREASSH